MVTIEFDGKELYTIELALKALIANIDKIKKPSKNQNLIKQRAFNLLMFIKGR